MIVNSEISADARAIAVVVVPESRIKTWPSFTFRQHFRNPQLFLVMKLLFLAQRRIFERPFAQGSAPPCVRWTSP